MRFSANFFKSFATYPAYDTNEIMIRVVGTSTINPQMHEEITKTIRIKLYEHPIGSINIHGPSEIKITSNYINLDQYFQNSIIGDEQYLNAGLK
jgi:hypothetical protein